MVFAPNPKIDKVIQVVILLLGLLFLFAIASCSTEKRLERSIRKHGQKQSAEYFSAHYREYFDWNNTPVPLIIHDTITVFVEGDSLKKDSAEIQIDSTLVLENENLLVKIKRLTEKLFDVQASSKPKEIQVPVQVDAPQQPQPKLEPCPECDPVKEKIPWYVWLIIAVLSLTTLGGAISYITRRK